MARTPRAATSPTSPARRWRQGPDTQASYFTGKLASYDTANYVPPNAYATAKVLVGVDGAAGVAAQADPKPVLFRITGPAVSVGSNGRYQSTDLRGCLVNGRLASFPARRSM
jgi:hypothetical protein